MTEIAIIGGTGLNILTDSFEFNGHDSTVEIKGEPDGIDTPYGRTSSPLTIFTRATQRFIFMARHGQPHRIPPHRINYRANIWALSQLGVRKIIAVNAVGGVGHEIATGALVLPDQIIDYTYGREHTYFDGFDYSDRFSAADKRNIIASTLEHVDFSRPYCTELRGQLTRAAADAQINIIDSGVYGATQGPRLESAAEIERLRRDGCTVVGMTGMPEAALARELGLNYAALCLVVNPAAGRNDEPITLTKMQAVMAGGMLDIKKVLAALLTM